MSWVKDTVSLGAIEQELQRRTGTKYPWGEYKSEPKRDACQCPPCQKERERLLCQAKKREQDLSCPQRMAKEPEQSHQSNYAHYQNAVMNSMGMGFFTNYSGPSDIWDEVVKEADSPRALQTGPKPTTAEEKRQAFRRWDTGRVLMEEIYMDALTDAFIKPQISEVEKPKKEARTPLNTIKPPPGQRQPNKKKRSR